MKLYSQVLKWKWANSFNRFQDLKFQKTLKFLLTSNLSQTSRTLLQYSNCSYGQWQCTKRLCPHRCSIIGFEHVTTFDGFYYSFQTPNCWYTLVEVRRSEGKEEGEGMRGDMKKGKMKMKGREKKKRGKKKLMKKIE